MSPDALEPIMDVVRSQILRLKLPGLEAQVIGADSRLIEDLGLDSLKFVDLTFWLEEALGIAEFPMQEWVDAQLESGSELTVGALALACQKEVARRSRE